MPAQGKADDIQKTFAHKLGETPMQGKRNFCFKKSLLRPSNIPL